MVVRKKHFDLRGSNDPKLRLLRRADTERNTVHSLASQERSRSALVVKRAITLPRVKFLEKPLEENE